MKLTNKAIAVIASAFYKVIAESNKEDALSLPELLAGIEFEVTEDDEVDALSGMYSFELSEAPEEV